MNATGPCLSPRRAMAVTTLPTAAAGKAAGMTSPTLSPLMGQIVEASRKYYTGGTIPANELLTFNNLVRPIMAGTPVIFAAMARQISQARREVLLQTFVWDDASAPAKAIVAALANLAGKQQLLALEGKFTQPVQVRIVVRHSPLVRFTGRTTGTLQKFIGNLDPTWVVAQLWEHQERCIGALHSKSLVTDGTVALLAGANLERKNDPDVSWFDSGCIVSGSAVQALRTDLIRAIEHSKLRAANTPCMPDLLSLVPAPVGRDVVLVASRRGEGNPFVKSSSNPLGAAILTAMDGAKQRLSILTPNLNAEPIVRALLAALRRGVSVELLLPHQFDQLTNSRLLRQGGGNEHTVKRLQRALRQDARGLSCLHVRWFSADGKGPVRGNGPGTSHAKGMAVDDVVLFTGSFNCDTQSFYHSREIAAIVDSAERTKAWYSTVFSPKFFMAVPE